MVVKINRNKISAEIVIELCEVGVEARPHDCYLALCVIYSSSMGRFNGAWCLTSKDCVELLDTGETYTQDSNLLAEMLALKLTELTEPEKVRISEKLTADYCEEGCLVTAEDLVDLHQICVEADKVACAGLVEAFENDAEYWEEQKRLENEEAL